MTIVVLSELEESNISMNIAFVLDLAVSRDSLRFYAKALCIGTIELSNGIKIPIPKAIHTEYAVGRGEVSSPISSVNTTENRPPIAGTDSTNPTITEGMTNMKLCIITMVTMPVLLRPTILITPNSKVFASTLIISRE
jgi:hypothetical protein